MDRLLALSTIEGMQALKQKAMVDLPALINKVLDEIRPQLTNTTIQLAVNLQAADPVSGDPFLLRQAVFNLVQNAVDFSTDQGQIGVTLTQRENVLWLAVDDDGPGIPDFARERVFDKFFFLRRPDTGEKSTGLGLNFVKVDAQETHFIVHWAIKVNISAISVCLGWGVPHGGERLTC